TRSVRRASRPPARRAPRRLVAPRPAPHRGTRPRAPQGVRAIERASATSRAWECLGSEPPETVEPALHVGPARELMKETVQALRSEDTRRRASPERREEQEQRRRRDGQAPTTARPARRIPEWIDRGEAREHSRGDGLELGLGALRRLLDQRQEPRMLVARALASGTGLEVAAVE